MKNIPEPLKSVLRDYCHVEWFEINDLAADVKNPNWALDVDALKVQFLELISSEDIPFSEINDLTLNELTSSALARSWLEDVFRQVF